MWVDSIGVGAVFNFGNICCCKVFLNHLLQFNTN